MRVLSPHLIVVLLTKNRVNREFHSSPQHKLLLGDKKREGSDSPLKELLYKKERDQSPGPSSPNKLLYGDRVGRESKGISQNTLLHSNRTNGSPKSNSPNKLLHLVKVNKEYEKILEDGLSDGNWGSKESNAIPQDRLMQEKDLRIKDSDIYENGEYKIPSQDGSINENLES